MTEALCSKKRRKQRLCVYEGEKVIIRMQLDRLSHFLGANRTPSGFTLIWQNLELWSTNKTALKCVTYSINGIAKGSNMDRWKCFCCLFMKMLKSWKLWYAPKCFLEVPPKHQMKQTEYFLSVMPQGCEWYRKLFKICTWLPWPAPPAVPPPPVAQGQLRQTN